MKKLLLIAMAAMATLTVKAETKTYTDQLVVTVNGSESKMTATVEVESLKDNYINFRLNNFTMEQEGNNMYVGNIVVSNLYLTQKDGYQAFSYNANLMITAGNIEGVEEDSWVGPLISPVPVRLKGTMAGDRLFVNIDIDMMSTLGQIIMVQFGKNFVADPIVTSAKDYSAQMGTKLISTDYQSLGEVTELDNNANTTTVTRMSDGTVALQVKDILLSLGGESMKFGSISIPAFEPTTRNGYDDLAFEDTLLVTGNEALETDVKALVKFKGSLSDTQLYYTLSVDFGEDVAAEIYNFQFGTDFVKRGVKESKTYTDDLVITVNDVQTDPTEASVVMEYLENKGINFTLRDFVMELEGNSMYVGNIMLEDLPLYTQDAVANPYGYFHFNGNIEITAGSDEEQTWIGPELGIIPLRLKGSMDDKHLYVTIDIDMQESLGQTIHVLFGTHEPTAINSIYNTQVSNKWFDGKYYDLSGRRIMKPAKGLYIQNGKKVIR